MPPKTCPRAQRDFRNAWTNHAVWTKAFIDGLLTGAPEGYMAVLTQRLKENQDNIGELVGGELGETLADLLWEHIQLAAATAAAAKATGPDSEGTKRAVAKQMANTDRVAAQMTRINSWSMPAGKARAMFRKHNRQVIDQVVAGLSSDWGKLVDLFDDYLSDILDMADMFVLGVECMCDHQQMSAHHFF